jgi:hypothetical protein
MVIFKMKDSIKICPQNDMSFILKIIVKMEAGRMKKTWTVLGLILLGTIPLFAQSSTKYVKVKSENIRQEPGGNKIGEVVAGTQVNVLERQTNWTKIQITGWIWDKSLTSDPSYIEGFRVQASHILVETQDKAQDIINQLNQGADFSELARTHSIDHFSARNGGDLGEFSRGDFLPEFDQVVFKLKAGEISGIVKTELGYHIIKRVK